MRSCVENGSNERIERTLDPIDAFSALLWITYGKVKPAVSFDEYLASSR